MLNNLLAGSGWIFDLVFFLILVLVTALGAYRGFIKGLAKFAGKIVSLIFAFLFCVSFANFLETCFHMTTAIANGIAGAIAKNELYNIGTPYDVAGAEISAVLSEIGIGAFPRWLIKISFSNVALIPQGTTAAVMLGSTLAKWISIVIAFIALIIIMRLGVGLVASLVSRLIHKFCVLRKMDQILGAILGLFKAFLLIFLLLCVCRWLPIDSLHTFIESSSIVGKIFTSEWFASATSYTISGEWLLNFLQ